MSVESIKTILLLRDPSQSTETRLDDMIAQAMLQLNATVFGDKYDTACALLVLHWIAKESSSSGAAGPVVMEKEGDLQRRYADPTKSGSTSDYDTTQWGRELSRMIKTYTQPYLNTMCGYVG